MKSKKILSSALALVMSLSLAVPAFADSSSADPNTTEIDGTYQAVVIDVKVPSIGKAFINPYGLDISVPQDVSDDTNTNETVISGQQIVTAPMSIQNRTAMDLQVNATVTGAVTALSDANAIPMKLATATTKGSGTEGQDGYVAPATSKSAFVYLQAKSADDTTGGGAAIATECAAWAASGYSEATDVIVSTRATTKENLVVLRGADVNATTGAFNAYNAGSIALFRLTGDCVMSPSNAWTENDKFTATVAFTFIPAQITKYAVTVDNVGGTGTTTGVTATASVATAAEGDTVTITIAGVTAGETATIAVTDADSGNVTVTPNSFTATGGTTGTTATFTMPAKAVTVSVTVA